VDLSTGGLAAAYYTPAAIASGHADPAKRGRLSCVQVPIERRRESMERKPAKKILRKADLKKTKGGTDGAMSTSTATAPRDVVSGNSTGRRAYKFFY
jgi:hypothetical protein